jgi:hypothetical protein
MVVVQLTESRKQHAIIHYVPTGTQIPASAEAFWKDPELVKLAAKHGITIEAVTKSKVKALGQ